MTKDDLITISTKQLDATWTALEQLGGLNHGMYSPRELNDAYKLIIKILQDPNPKVDGLIRTNTKTYETAFDISHMLGFLRLAGQQRPENSPQSPRTATSQSLSKIEELVNSCYEPFADYVSPHIQIIPIYFQDKYLARPKVPVPFVILPNYVEPGNGKQDEKQAEWIGVAHEIGHHIYRQVPNLREELEISVARKLQSSELTINKKNQQRLWFNYLEEVFADLIGVMSLGAAFVYSQHVMILSSVLSFTYQGESTGTVTCDYDKLLVSSDPTHPIPFLRGEMGVYIYGKLLASEMPQHLIDLETEWKSVFLQVKEALGLATDEITPIYMDDPNTPKSPLLEDKCYSKESDPAGYGKLSYYDTIDVMEMVIDTILDTKLKSLANKSLSDVASGYFHLDEQARNASSTEPSNPTIASKREEIRNKIAISRLNKNKELISPAHAQ